MMKQKTQTAAAVCNTLFECARALAWHSRQNAIERGIGVGNAERERKRHLGIHDLGVDFFAILIEIIQSPQKYKKGLF